MRKVALTLCLLAMVVGRSFAESTAISYYHDLNAILRHHLGVVQQREGMGRKIIGGVGCFVGVSLGVGGFLSHSLRTHDPFGFREALSVLFVESGGVCLLVSVPLLLIPTKA